MLVSAEGEQSSEGERDVASDGGQVRQLQKQLCQKDEDMAAMMTQERHNGLIKRRMQNTWSNNLHTLQEKTNLAIGNTPTKDGHKYIYMMEIRFCWCWEFLQWKSSVDHMCT